LGLTIIFGVPSIESVGFITRQWANRGWW